MSEKKKTKKRDTIETTKEATVTTETKIMSHSEMLNYYLKMVYLFNKQVNDDDTPLTPEQTHVLTNEKDLEISAYDLGVKLLDYKMGKHYGAALSVVGTHLERNGLMKTKRNDEGKVIVDIPDWNLFITAIDLYYKLLGPFTKR